MSNYLFVTTLTRIYKITPKRKISLFMDVEFALKNVTGRALSLENAQHGGVRAIAFHPDFKRNRLFYISCMEERPKNTNAFPYISDEKNPIDADGVLLEFKVDEATDKPILSSYRNVFRVGMPVYDHAIKQIIFYGDLLYIAHGDGSVQAAIAGGGQNSDGLGKILRINPLKQGKRPYSIPRDNPFRYNRNMKPEVFALGFRNPHHICFGKDGTFYAVDTGRSNVEEVNLVVKGGNYGWSKREGTFVHNETDGGLVSGVYALPDNDAKYNFIYPVAQVGHEGKIGDGFIGQAIAGACPIENGSPMSGNYFYSDFPETGKLYFSSIKELKAAKTKGDPWLLTQARTRQATVWYETAGGKVRKLNSLGDVIRSQKGLENSERADVRFGRGAKGELYWSSKVTGKIYVFTSSLKGGPGGVPRSALW